MLHLEISLYRQSMRIHMSQFKSQLLSQLISVHRRLQQPRRLLRRLRGSRSRAACSLGLHLTRLQLHPHWELQVRLRASFGAVESGVGPRTDAQGLNVV